MGKKRLNKKQGLSFEVICLGAALCVVLGVFLLVNQNKGLQKSSLGVSQTAEAAHSTSSGQAVYGLPKPTQLISTSKIHSSPVLKGIKIDPNDPFKLEFIIDTEDEEDVSEEEVRRLVEYFLAALTIPEEDLWVNLSPYEENKIIPKNLSHTELGKDLLGEDYVLKQLVSSLTYPESKLGRKYWNKVYEEVRKIAGTTNLPIDTFNKVWIVPENAKVYENGNVALVHQTKLKVMHEEDYLAAKENKIVKEDSRTDKAGQIGQVSAGVMKEIIIPEVEKEVNNGRNFARLRQMYNSFVLAAWFKEKLKDSIFQYYIDQGKIEGIDLEDKDVKEKVYNLYVKAYKEGVYNYIKKDYDAASRQYLRRKYYSGGITGFTAQGVERESSSPARMKADVDIEKCRGWEVDLDPIVGAMHEAVERKEISYLQKEKVTITSGGQKQMVRQNNSS